MDTNKLTTKSRDAVSAALRTALTEGNPYAEPSHLLHALLQVPGNTAAPCLPLPVPIRPSLPRCPGCDLEAAVCQGFSVSQPNLSGSFARVLADAEVRAEQLGDAYVATEHLLISLATIDSDAKKVLAALNVKPNVLTRAFNDARGSKRVTSPEAEGTSSALDQYGVDLTAMARDGKLDPVIGGTRDSACRPGPGPADQEQPRADRRARRRQDRRRRRFGATAGGWRCARFTEKPPPGSARLAIDGGRVEVSRRVRGASQGCIDRDQDAAGQIITFIDELHTVVGAGATSDSSMDAGNMLKPMLARGELRMIGATTLDEYRERIEKDPAFERRFQQVFVDEPSVEDTIAILRGLRERYEAHHKVAITDAALVGSGNAVEPLHHLSAAARQGD
jgi:ATP-dependent Clp protease ATP-binding subunit ClpB